MDHKWAPPGDWCESLSWTAGPGFFLGISLDLTQHERHRSLLGRKPGSFSEWELEAGPGGPPRLSSVAGHLNLGSGCITCWCLQGITYSSLGG